MEPIANAVSVPWYLPLTTPQCCTHWLGMKFVQANACPYRSANCLYTIGCPSDNCYNQGLTQVPTVSRLTTNVIKTIEEAQKFALTLCHAFSPVVFHQEVPAFSTSVLPRGDEWPASPLHSNTDHEAPAITKTVTPDPATPAAIRSGKRNSNRARPSDGQTT